MCSIYGCIGKNYSDIEPLFSKELNHRGPDDGGFFVDNEAKVSLGHTRLSIIDLSAHGHQPMVNKDNRYTIVFNGEVYNYQEIRNELEKLGHAFNSQSDTEVILQSFIEWEEKCLDKFRGMFAFVIYDKNTNELFLARDRFGIKPLIYTFTNEDFLFSSELSPLMKSGFIPSVLNEASVSDYFAYGAVQQPKTIIKNAYYLMPGHYMKVDIGLNYHIEKYYDLVTESKKIEHIDSYDEAVIMVRKALEEATRYHLVADVDVGAFLSGGVDSTAVVALMNHYVNKPINTFSVGFDQQGEVKDELSIAANTAKMLHTNHNEIVVDEQYIINIFDDFIDSIDQPSIDGINTYIVSRETSKNIKVALSGLGGDEIFAGYPHFKNIYENIDTNKNIYTLLGIQLNKIKPNRFTNHFELIGLSPEEGVLKTRILDKRQSYPIEIEDRSDLSTIQRITKVEIDNYLLSTLLRDNDVLSMANSLEVRPILLDHKLVELVFSLADNYKIRDKRLKAIFIDSVKDIIPEETWQRKKTGFEMPFATWMNGVLNSRVRSVAENAQKSRLLTTEIVQSFLKRANNKKLKRNDWILFVFFSWIEKNGVKA